VRVYCDSADHHPDDPLAPQKLKEIETMGFTALKIDIDMHGRYGQARGHRAGTLQADVAGRAGPGREHRRHARHPPVHQDADLLR
jgi:hypothetical protein